MGAGKFYATHAVRAKADPVGHALNLATLKHERHVSDLKAEHAEAIAALQRALTASQAALRQAEADADRQQRQFEASAAALRQDLEIARTALGQAQAENERMRRRLKQCEPLLALIAATTREGSDLP
jgi:hypothetical protein